MPLLWHGKVDTAGRDPQRNNGMWIRTFLWFKKLKPSKYRRLVLTLQALPQHITNCHRVATETFVIPAGMGPQDKFLIKLATKSRCVVKVDILGKIRGSDNDPISLLNTTTSLKGTKNILFPLFICEYFVCGRYQCHHIKTYFGQMHPKETLTCSVALKSFCYLCTVGDTWRSNQKPFRQNAGRMVYDTLVSSDFLGARQSFLHASPFSWPLSDSLRGSSTELLVHAVPMLATYSTIMFLARAASPDRYNLQTSSGCIYCAYFGRYGRNLKALQHLLVTYAKWKFKNYHVGVWRTWAQLLSFNAWVQLSITP